MRSPPFGPSGSTTTSAVPGRQKSTGSLGLALTNNSSSSSNRRSSVGGSGSSHSHTHSHTYSISQPSAPTLVKHSSTSSSTSSSAAAGAIPLASPTSMQSPRQSSERERQGQAAADQQQQQQQQLQLQLQQPLKSSEMDMLDGIVDMDAFSQILALDEHDPTREFSKALIWAFCDQAETAVEEMEHFLVKNHVEQLANKAHYLKGSSASLGLMKVSKTCLSIYHTHFIPTLAHFRSYSYQTDYSATSTDSHPHSAHSSSSSVPSLASPMSPSGSNGYQRVRFASTSSTGSSPKTPAIEPEEMDFEAQKRAKASALVTQLKEEIREATEWLYAYYQGADAYEASK